MLVLELLLVLMSCFGEDAWEQSQEFIHQDCDVEMKGFTLFSCLFLRIFISLRSLFIDGFMIALFRHVTPCSLINTKGSEETPLPSYRTLLTEIQVPAKRCYLYISPQVVVRNPRWICLVNIVMKFRGPQRAQNFFPNKATLYFSTRSLIHEVSASL